MSEERILDRVRKMLALANDTAATEGERDNALRMAHNLMAKHQLDMADVDQRKRDLDDPRGLFTLDGWNIPWCRRVRHAIARLFMCKYYSGKINATRGRHTFIGRESNATTAMLMGDWIVLGLLREADKRYGHRLTPMGRSFGEGAASKLHERVNQLLADKQKEFTSAGYALVIADLAKIEADANEEFHLSTGTKLKPATARNSKLNVDAFYSGKDHAGTIGLNTQLANKKGTLAITE